MHKNTSGLLILFAVSAFTLASGTYPDADPELEALQNAKKCSSTKDCGPGYCCTVGYFRYSEPICKKLSTYSSRCRRRMDGEDRDLSWPNGVSKHYENLFVEICPCEANLSCINDRCIAAKKYQSKKPNTDTNTVGSRY